MKFGYFWKLTTQITVIFSLSLAWPATAVIAAPITASSSSAQSNTKKTEDLKNWYSIELVVLGNTRESALTSESWQEAKWQPPEPIPVAELLENQFKNNRQKFGDPQTVAKKSLKDELSPLYRRGQYRLLATRAWQQKIDTREAPGRFRSEEVLGSIRFTRKKYLLAEVNLDYLMPEPAPADDSDEVSNQKSQSEFTDLVNEYTIRLADALKPDFEMPKESELEFPKLPIKQKAKNPPTFVPQIALHQTKPVAINAIYYFDHPVMPSFLRIKALDEADIVARESQENSQ